MWGRLSIAAGFLCAVVGTILDPCNITEDSQTSFVLYPDCIDRRDPTEQGDLNITFKTPFNYFGESKSSILAYDNGVLSFETIGKPDYLPTAENFSLIAPYWTDKVSDLYRKTSCGETSNRLVLERLGSDIKNALGVTYSAQWGFLCSWEGERHEKSANDSSPSSQSGFQVVLTSDGNYSFAIFNYLNVGGRSGNRRDRNIQAGVDAGDGNTFCSIKGSGRRRLQRNIQSSNVGVPGRWIFRVDAIDLQVPGCISLDPELFLNPPSSVVSPKLRRRKNRRKKKKGKSRRRKRQTREFSRTHSYQRVVKLRQELADLQVRVDAMSKEERATQSFMTEINRRLPRLRLHVNRLKRELRRLTHETGRLDQEMTRLSQITEDGTLQGHIKDISRDVMATGTKLTQALARIRDFEHKLSSFNVNVEQSGQGVIQGISQEIVGLATDLSSSRQQIQSLERYLVNAISQHFQTTSNNAYMWRYRTLQRDRYRKIKFLSQQMLGTRHAAREVEYRLKRTERELSRLKRIQVEMRDFLQKYDRQHSQLQNDMGRNTHAPVEVMHTMTSFDRQLEAERQKLQEIANKLRSQSQMASGLTRDIPRFENQLGYVRDHVEKLSTSVFAQQGKLSGTERFINTVRQSMSQLHSKLRNGNRPGQRRERNMSLFSENLAQSRSQLRLAERQLESAYRYLQLIGRQMAQTAEYLQTLNQYYMQYMRRRNYFGRPTNTNHVSNRLGQLSRALFDLSRDLKRATK